MREQLFWHWWDSTTWLHITLWALKLIWLALFFLPQNIDSSVIQWDKTYLEYVAIIVFFPIEAAPEFIQAFYYEELHMVTYGMDLVIRNLGKTALFPQATPEGVYNYTC